MATPCFVLLVDAADNADTLAAHRDLAQRVGEQTSQVLGFEPAIEVVALPQPAHREMFDVPEALTRLIDARTGNNDEQSVYLLPVSFDFDLHRKQMLTAFVRESQRRAPHVQLHYDDLAPTHPLLLHAFVDAAGQAIAATGARSPKELGVLLIASGTGDAVTRAASYALMRLLWEQIGAARGDVAFIRHTNLPVPEQLEACARSGLTWLVVPQYLWPCEQLDFARIIFEDFQKQHAPAHSWQLGRCVGDHPNVQAWVAQRITELHRAHRTRSEQRQRSAQHASTQPLSRVHGPAGARALDDLDPERDSYAGALIAEVAGRDDLAQLFGHVGLTNPSDTSPTAPAPPLFLKVTWHGYATGTFTDPAALSTVLAALPSPAVVLEGHTASRNRSPADFDWETEARQHRGWIKEQETDYLRRTGLSEVLQRHGASYLNVTEAYWDDACADRDQVLSVVAEHGYALHHSELASFVPRAVFDQRGSKLLSLARFKGPTRLGISNLFGLLPPPLRSAWHGPNITYFAQVCCDLAKLYSSLFDCYTLVESLTCAVRWEQRGLYRSRWGNYDLVPSPGVVTLSRGFAAADVLASRLQGQDVRRSAFFDVVQHELGFPEELAAASIGEALVRRFV